jgi:phosphate-selective porin OprO/OprP
MLRLMGSRLWLCFLAVVAATSSSLADDASDSLADAQALARLEQQARLQQERIESLEQQLAAAQGQTQDAARVEVLKQQIREVLSEQEFRESLMPSMMQAGYDKGFYIQSSDDNFLIKINGQMQFRWTHYNVQSRNRYLQPRLRKHDSTGFDLQRLRLNFSGHVFSPELTYVIYFRSEAPDGYDTRLRDAYVNYKFSDAFQFQVGYFKTAALQQRLTSSADLQFVDRSMVHAVFDLSRNVGVRFWGKLFEKRLEWFFDVTNSFNGAGNRTITNDPPELDGDPGLAFRLVWHALGDDPGKDLKVESDIEFHDSPALDFAFHYAFNDDQGDAETTEIPFPIPRRRAGVGGFGLTDTNGLQLNQFGFASAFKWRGFSARGEYILRMIDPRRAGRQPFASWWLMTRQGDTTVQHGAYLQMGYFLPVPGLERKLEAVARVGGISTLANGQEGAWEYAGGLNYFIHKDKVKLQADVTKVTEVPISSNGASLANVNDRPLIFRVQLQVKF